MHSPTSISIVSPRSAVSICCVHGLSALDKRAGIRVKIHGAATMPFPDESGVSIPTGTEAIINLHLVEKASWTFSNSLALQEHVSRVTMPEGVCRDEKSKNRYKFLYSQTVCSSAFAPHKHHLELRFRRVTKSASRRKSGSIVCASRPIIKSTRRLRPAH